MTEILQRVDTPFHSYTIPGQYFLTLVVHGYGNCFDTAEQLITLKGQAALLISLRNPVAFLKQFLLMQ